MVRPTELLREPEASPEGRIRVSWGRRAELPRYRAGFPQPRVFFPPFPASFTLMARSQFWLFPGSVMMIVLNDFFSLSQPEKIALE